MLCEEMGMSGMMYAMTLGFEEAGGDRGQSPPITPFSMNKFFVPPASTGGAAQRPATNIIMPPIDVRIGPDVINLAAEMPGIPGENIEIRVLPNRIEIIGEPPDEMHPGDDLQAFEERLPVSGRARRFTGAVPPRGARAKYKDGVLELRLPMRLVLPGGKISSIPVR
jgi:HSP20 family molecular chaperone IbpA